MTHHHHHHHHHHVSEGQQQQQRPKFLHGFMLRMLTLAVAMVALWVKRCP
jgi:hypothetical protein